MLKKKKKENIKTMAFTVISSQKRTDLVKDLLAHKKNGFFKNFTRISEDFFLLLDCIKPRIERQDTLYRKAIPTEEGEI